MDRNWIYLGIFFVLGIALATILSNFTSYTVFSQSKYQYYEEKIKELTNKSLQCEIKKNNLTVELNKLRSEVSILKGKIQELEEYKILYENLSERYNKLLKDYENLKKEYNETLQKLERIKSILG